MKATAKKTASGYSVSIVDRNGRKLTIAVSSKAKADKIKKLVTVDGFTVGQIKMLYGKRPKGKAKPKRSTTKPRKKKPSAAAVRRGAEAPKRKAKRNVSRAKTKAKVTIRKLAKGYSVSGKDRLGKAIPKITVTTKAKADNAKRLVEQKGMTAKQIKMLFGAAKRAVKRVVRKAKAPQRNAGKTVKLLLGEYGAYVDVPINAWVYQGDPKEDKYGDWEVRVKSMRAKDVPKGQMAFETRHEAEKDVQHWLKSNPGRKATAKRQAAKRNAPGITMVLADYGGDYTTSVPPNKFLYMFKRGVLQRIKAKDVPKSKRLTGDVWESKQGAIQDAQDYAAGGPRGPRSRGMAEYNPKRTRRNKCKNPSPHDRVATYKIKGKVGIDAGTYNYIVYAMTNKGRKDLAYYKSYRSASAAANSINKHGKWTGGRDPKRGISVIQVRGKTATVHYTGSRKNPAKPKRKKHSNAALKKAFLAMRAKVAKRCPQIKSIGFGIDPKIHDKPRHFGLYYPMTKSRGGQVGLAPEIAYQPMSVVRGIILHELGHALIDLGCFPKAKSCSYDAIERRADAAAKAASGMQIYYGKDNVQRAGPGASGKKLRPKGLR